MKGDFYTFQAQTSPHPLALEISHAKGSYIFDQDGKKYLDFIAGVSANTLGHGNAEVNKAIIAQLEKHSHVMVYGEFIQATPLALAKQLATISPDPLNSIYLTNSGTEATEAALKLAKRHTGRFEVIAAHNAYHGNSQGAMSICGNESKNSAYRPLIPGARFIRFNNIADINKITSKTAAVILETIQGGAGFICPKDNYLKKVQERCKSVGALFILDEIQTGIGRTGTFYGFEQHGVVPDMVIAGKGLGGGMPIGALISSLALMSDFKTKPELGHITTFGGHPVISAAALATLNELYTGSIMTQIDRKEKLIRKQLTHPLIKEIRGKGLMLALLFEDEKIASDLILASLKEGLLLFWLLFENRAVRITPPLTISDQEINAGCQIILKILDQLK